MTKLRTLFGLYMIRAVDCELAFCLSKEKIELFFQKSKIDLYMAQIDPALSEMKNLDPKHISNNLS